MEKWHPVFPRFTHLLQLCGLMWRKVISYLCLDWMFGLRGNSWWLSRGNSKCQSHISTVSLKFASTPSWHTYACHYFWSTWARCARCCTTVCRRVCLSVSVGRSMDVRRPYMCPFRPQRGSCVHSATHLPYDKEDECSAQHQGEHVAEGRKGERHGCASQPDDEMGWAGERKVPPLLSASLLAFAHSPSFVKWRLLSVSPSGVSWVCVVQVGKAQV